MTIQMAAVRTGLSVSKITKMCKDGKIDYSYAFNRQGRHCIDIDDDGIQQILEIEDMKRWDANAELRKCYAPVYKKKEKTVPTDFKRLMKKLEKYNREHGTNYSYGIATAKGII